MHQYFLKESQLFHDYNTEFLEIMDNIGSSRTCILINRELVAERGETFLERLLRLIASTSGPDTVKVDLYSWENGLLCPGPGKPISEDDSPAIALSSFDDAKKHLLDRYTLVIGAF